MAVTPTINRSFRVIIGHLPSPGRTELFANWSVSSLSARGKRPPGRCDNSLQPAGVCRRVWGAASLPTGKKQDGQGSDHRRHADKLHPHDRLEIVPPAFAKQEKPDQ